MTTKRIVCSNRDSSVAVLVPAPECLGALRAGGYISMSLLGRDGLRRFLYVTGRAGFKMQVPLAIAREWEIHKLVSDPLWRPDRTDRKRIASKWVDALILGGVEEAEALRLIADKDAPAFSTAHEVVDVSQMPDRWFRNAWRRSHNGGPIVIDLEAARGIQFERIRTQHRRARMSRWLELRPQKVAPIDWGGLRSAIERAGDVEELRHIWPNGLPVA